MTAFTYPPEPHVRRHGPQRYADAASYRPWLRDEFTKLMGFPDDLPNLARLRPPGGNSRPHGIERSYFVQKKKAILPDTY